jgi:hypothetical protein
VITGEAGIAPAPGIDVICSTASCASMRPPPSPGTLFNVARASVNPACRRRGTSYSRHVPRCSLRTITLPKENLLSCCPS